MRTGELDVRVGLGRVRVGRFLDDTEHGTPANFGHRNGWVVAALQGAWSAIGHTSGLAEGLQTAVRGGGDTAMVAAIAGALLCARHGGSAVPGCWRRALHGWPGLLARDLTRLGALAARGGP